jgi:hypothetical protein
MWIKCLDCEHYEGLSASGYVRCRKLGWTVAMVSCVHYKKREKKAEAPKASVR